MPDESDDTQSDQAEDLADFHESEVDLSRDVPLGTHDHEHPTSQLPDPGGLG